MAQIWEYIKIALMNIKSNKGRSVLTMLGIIIGIASVIMVIAIGNGVRGQVNDDTPGATSPLPARLHRRLRLLLRCIFLTSHVILR